MQKKIFKNVWKTKQNSRKKVHLTKVSQAIRYQKERWKRACFALALTNSKERRSPCVLFWRIERRSDCAREKKSTALNATQLMLWNNIRKVVRETFGLHFELPELKNDCAMRPRILWQKMCSGKKYKKGEEKFEWTFLAFRKQDWK